MGEGRKIAKILIGLGGFVLIAGSILHLIGGYPRAAAALAASNLNRGMKEALGSVFLLIAVTWIIVAAAALTATFVRSHTSRLIILVCGFGLLIEVPIWVAMMGWFIGNEMFLVGSALIVCGGLMFRDQGSLRA